MTSHTGDIFFLFSTGVVLYMQVHSWNTFILTRIGACMRERLWPFVCYNVCVLDRRWVMCCTVGRQKVKKRRCLLFHQVAIDTSPCGVAIISNVSAQSDVWLRRLPCDCVTREVSSWRIQFNVYLKIFFLKGFISPVLLQPCMSYTGSNFSF